MRRQAFFAVGALAAMAAACGSTEQPEVVEQIVVRERGVPAPAAAPVAEARDLVAMGESAFQICSGCHTIEAGLPSAAGPNLHGVFGREAGSLEDFAYSDAMTSSEITWDEASLDAFLADPAGYLPGTGMIAGAAPDDENRAAIIAYLADASE